MRGQWVRPNARSDKNSWRFDLKRGWVEPGADVPDGGFQYSLPAGSVPSIHPVQYNVVTSPPGTKAPAGAVTYTPRTKEMHSDGSQAPVEETNVSIVPAYRDPALDQAPPEGPSIPPNEAARRLLMALGASPPAVGVGQDGGSIGLGDIYDLAFSILKDEDMAKAATAIALVEGGLGGAVGDRESGGSYGPYQFHRRGMLPYFAKHLGVDIDTAAEVARTNPMAAAEWALKGYLGAALRKGKSLGLRGADLARYAQTHGQRSVPAGAKAAAEAYRNLFEGGGSTEQLERYRQEKDLTYASTPEPGAPAGEYVEAPEPSVSPSDQESPPSVEVGGQPFTVIPFIPPIIMRRTRPGAPPPSSTTPPALPGPSGRGPIPLGPPSRPIPLPPGGSGRGAIPLGPPSRLMLPPPGSSGGGAIPLGPSSRPAFQPTLPVPLPRREPSLPVPVPRGWVPSPVPSPLGGSPAGGGPSGPGSSGWWGGIPGALGKVMRGAGAVGTALWLASMVPAVAELIRNIPGLWEGNKEAAEPQWMDPQTPMPAQVPGGGWRPSSQATPQAGGWKPPSSIHEPEDPAAWEKQRGVASQSQSTLTYRSPSSAGGGIGGIGGLEGLSDLPDAFQPIFVTDDAGQVWIFDPNRKTVTPTGHFLAKNKSWASAGTDWSTGTAVFIDTSDPSNVVRVPVGSPKPEYISGASGELYRVTPSGLVQESPGKRAFITGPSGEIYEATGEKFEKVAPGKPTLVQSGRHIGSVSPEGRFTPLWSFPPEPQRVSTVGSLVSIPYGMESSVQYVRPPDMYARTLGWVPPVGSGQGGPSYTRSERDRGEDGQSVTDLLPPKQENERQICVPESVFESIVSGRRGYGIRPVYPPKYFSIPDNPNPFTISWEEAGGVPVGSGADTGGWVPPVPPEAVVGTGHRFGEPVSMEGIHKGLDFQAYEGTPAVSPVSGTVVAVENDPSGLGIQVVIRDDRTGEEHRLSHLLEASVKVGDRVRPGQEVGKVGSTGAGSTGPHLDYRIQTKDGAYINPEPLAGPLANLPRADRPYGAGQEAPPAQSALPGQVAASRLSSLRSVFYALEQRLNALLELPIGRETLRSVADRIGYLQPILNTWSQLSRALEVGDLDSARMWAQTLRMRFEELWRTPLSVEGSPEARPLWSYVSQDPIATEMGNYFSTLEGALNAIELPPTLAPTPTEQASIDQAWATIQDRRRAEDNLHAYRMAELAERARQFGLTYELERLRQQEIERHNRERERIDQELAKTRADLERERMSRDERMLAEQLRSQQQMRRDEQEFLVRQSALQNPWLKALSGSAPAWGAPGGPGYDPGTAMSWNPFGGDVRSELVPRSQPVGTGQASRSWVPRPTGWGIVDTARTMPINRALPYLQERYASLQRSLDLLRPMVEHAERTGEVTYDPMTIWDLSTSIPYVQQYITSLEPVGRRISSMMFMPFASMSPHERASLRTQVEALGWSWPTVAQQLREQWGREGITRTPDITRVAGASMSPLQKDSWNFVVETMGERPQDYWAQQERVWDKARQPLVSIGA